MSFDSLTESLITCFQVKFCFIFYHVACATKWQHKECCSNLCVSLSKFGVNSVKESRPKTWFTQSNANATFNYFFSITWLVFIFPIHTICTKIQMTVMSTLLHDSWTSRQTVRTLTSGFNSWVTLIPGRSFYPSLYNPSRSLELLPDCNIMAMVVWWIREKATTRQ